LSFDPSVVESFMLGRARAQATLDAESHWNHAVAGGRWARFKLRFVANFAEQSRAHRSALKAYEQLARFPETQLLLIVISDKASARRSLGATCRRKKFPRLHPTTQNRTCSTRYLNLLLETDVKQISPPQRSCRKVPEPASFPWPRLGFLRQHDPSWRSPV